MKIEIENAYDDYVQETLFMNQIRDQLDDVEPYNDKQNIVFTKSDNIHAFCASLMSMYEDAWEKKINEEDNNLSMYQTIDYSSMFRDDILNGFINPVESETEFGLYVNPVVWERPEDVNILGRKTADELIEETISF